MYKMVRVSKENFLEAFTGLWMHWSPEVPGDYISGHFSAVNLRDRKSVV